MIKTKPQQHQLTLSRLGLSLPLRAAQQRHEQRREEPRSHRTPHPFSRAVLTRLTKCSRHAETELQSFLHVDAGARHSQGAFTSRIYAAVAKAHVRKGAREAPRGADPRHPSHRPALSSSRALLMPLPQLPALLFFRLLSGSTRHGRMRFPRVTVSACIRLGSNDESQAAI